MAINPTGRAVFAAFAVFAGLCAAIDRDTKTLLPDLFLAAIAAFFTFLAIQS